MSSEDADGITLRGSFGQGVPGNLLTTQAVKKQPRQPRRQPGGEPGGRVEQRDHSVQIAVGGRAACPACRAHRLPGGAEARRLPHGPEHVVRGPTGFCALPGGGQQAGDPRRRISGRAADERQLARVTQCTGERFAGRLLPGRIRYCPQ